MTDPSKVITIIKGRQVGASVLAVGIILYHALKYPGIEIIYSSASVDKLRYFSLSRLRPIMEKSGVAFKTGQLENRIMEYTLYNGSKIFLYSDHNGWEGPRSVSSDLIFADEAQLADMSKVTNLREGMAHSKIGKLYFAGTGHHAGSSWESWYRKTKMYEYRGDAWKPDNPTAKHSGYHIPQSLLPTWTPEIEAEKRQLYNPAEYTMEVDGWFATGMAVPLPLHVVRECLIDSDWIEPKQSRHHLIAALDLAAGGDSYTVITITDYDPETDHAAVLYAARYDDMLTADLMPKIEDVVERYKPDTIVSDAGGNIELLAAISAKYDVTAYRLGPSHDAIKYGDTEHSVSKSFFVQQVITRFNGKKITVPNPEPWIADHLTAEQSETRDQPQGNSFLRFSKMPGRQDDMLMSLVFCECAIYQENDDNNPKNKGFAPILINNGGMMGENKRDPYGYSERKLDLWELEDLGLA